MDLIPDHRWEGTGFEIRFTPEEAGFGTVMLEITDAHGLLSMTTAMIEIR